MKNYLLATSVLCLLASACTSEQKANTSDTLKTDTIASVSDTASKPVDSAEMMKAWETYMTPGNEHKMLAQSEGNWLTELTFYQPDGKIMSTNPGIKTEIKMILGGRYQQATYKGTVDGMPFEGTNTLAYDNSRKVFISTWIDNMGTGLMYTEGTFNENRKTMTFKGKATDVVSKKDIQIREVFTLVDDNTQLMEMYDTKDGKEVKTMMIKLTRTK